MEVYQTMDSKTIQTLIKPGDEFKSYRSLCRHLNEPIKTGNSKISQIKSWKQFFNFEQKTGSNALIITEVYEQPKVKDDKRSSGNNNKYNTHICNILRYLLLGNNFVSGSLTHFVEKVGLANDLLSEIQYHPEKYYEYLDDIYYYDYLYFKNNIINTRLHNYIKTAFSHLEKNNEISIHQSIYAVKKRIDREKELQKIKKEISNLPPNVQNNILIMKTDFLDEQIEKRNKEPIEQLCMFELREIEETIKWSLLQDGYDLNDTNVTKQIRKMICESQQWEYYYVNYDLFAKHLTQLPDDFNINNCKHELNNMLIENLKEKIPIKLKQKIETVTNELLAEGKPIRSTIKIGDTSRIPTAFDSRLEFYESLSIKSQFELIERLIKLK